MPFPGFREKPTKKPVAADTTTTTTTTGTTATTEPRHKRAFLSHVPTIRQWIGDLWPDLTTIIVIGVVTIGLNEIDAVGGKARKFIIWNEQGEFINPSIGYNRQKNIIPIWLSAFLSVIIPTAVFALAQIRVRSFYDLHVAFWSNIWSIVLASTFQVFNKLLIGGVRPHFLDVCKPREGLRPGDGTGFAGLYFDMTICTGTNERYISDALKSWPSGHTSVAFGGFALLSLYLNAKLKIFSDERPMLWKLALFFLPLLGACLIGGAMILDHSHQWYDVFGGAVIGLCTSFTCYRANYASVWDFRFNHIPLPRPRSPWKPFGDDSGADHVGHFGHDGAIPGTANGTTAENGRHHGGVLHGLTAGAARGRKFVYSTDEANRFPDFAHGTKLRWAPNGAPGDAVSAGGYGLGSGHGYENGGLHSHEGGRSTMRGDVV